MLDPPRRQICMESLKQPYNIGISNLNATFLFGAENSEMGSAILHNNSGILYVVLIWHQNMLLKLKLLQEGGWFSLSLSRLPSLSPSSLPLPPSLIHLSPSSLLLPPFPYICLFPPFPSLNSPLLYLPPPLTIHPPTFTTIHMTFLKTILAPTCLVPIWHSE